MTQRTFLDYIGLKRFLSRLKAIIPTKTSELQNDSGYLTQHNPVDSSLSETSENAVQNKVVKGALDGKSDTGHTHTASEVSGLSAVATSGSYNDLSNTPTIPTVNNATLTIQKNGSTVKTFTANASSNVTANITVPTAVSELTNDSGYLTSASSLDSSKLTGTIDIARLPKGALERLVTVANQTARFALTTSDVQLGDTVKQLDTGVMYIVTDETKLNSADGYTEYTAGSATSVPWSGVTGKPSSFTPSSHTHGNVTNDGKLPTASRALITDSSKNITVSSVSDTELGYLSGVTSSVQTQLNGKAASSHTHLTSDVTDLLSGNHTWTGDNTFSKTIISQSNEVLSTTSTSIGIGETPANEQQKVFNFKDKNNDSLSYFRHLYKTTGASQLDFIVRNKFASGSPSTSGTIGYTSFSLELGSDGSKTGTLQATFKPSATSTYDLGTSSYKWRKVYSDDVVHTSGDESVSGTKSFNSDLNLNYASTDVDDIVNSVAGSATLDNFVHMTGNETVNGIKSFPDGVIANVTGSATSATNDGSGNVITSTYGKLGAANTWTENNTFYKQVCLTKVNDTSLQSKNSRAELGETNLSGDTYTQISFEDKNGDNFGYLRQVYGADGNNGFHFFVRNKFLNGVPDTTGTVDYSYFGLRLNPDKSKEAVFKASLRPYDSTYAYNLGDATYQWNNLYAKNYYYNGVAWGLDKANVWTGDNTYSTSIIYQSNHALGNLPQSDNSQTALKINDSAGTNYLAQMATFQNTDATGLRITIRDKFDSNGFSPSGSNRNKYFNFLQNAANQGYIRWDGYVNNSIIPLADNTYALGTSTNKWKTLNGINPGALSLPDGNASNSIAVDITDWYIQDPDYPDDPTKKILDATNHIVKTTVPGWLHIIFPNVAGNWAYARQYAAGVNMDLQRIADGVASSDFAVVDFIFPIYSSCYVRIKAKTATVRIFPCQGNV